MPDDKSVTSDFFLSLYERYQKLDNGMQAQLRRISEPDDLRETPALYRLFNQTRPYNNGLLRVVFLLPWCDDCGEARRASAPHFGRLLAEAGVSELRLFQIARSRTPFDVIQLRRLAIMLKHPAVNWKSFGKFLYRYEWDGSWSKKSKRQLIEDYFIAQPSPSDKQEAANEQ
jgi:CRISPR system Cascade subunit CasB